MYKITKYPRNAKQNNNEEWVTQDIVSDTRQPGLHREILSQIPKKRYTLKCCCNLAIKKNGIMWFLSFAITRMELDTINVKWNKLGIETQELHDFTVCKVKKIKTQKLTVAIRGTGMTG